MAFSLGRFHEGRYRRGPTSSRSCAARRCRADRVVERGCDRSFMATGKVGAPQLHALPELLDKAGADGLWRVILIHHRRSPNRSARFKRLIDASKFRGRVAQARCRARAAHGHDHIHSVVYLDGPSAQIPLSACRRPRLLAGKGIWPAATSTPSPEGQWLELQGADALPPRQRCLEEWGGAS